MCFIQLQFFYFNIIFTYISEIENTESKLKWKERLEGVVEGQICSITLLGCDEIPGDLFFLASLASDPNYQRAKNTVHLYYRFGSNDRRSLKVPFSFPKSL